MIRLRLITTVCIIAGAAAETFDFTNVCVGNKGDDFHSITFPETRKITKITLEYTGGGGITCSGGTGYPFGCGAGAMIQLVKAGTKTALHPQENVPFITWGSTSRSYCYRPSGGTGRCPSSTNTWSAKTMEWAVPKHAGSTMLAGQEYQFWSGEDLQDYAESDNTGTTCFTATFETAAPCGQLSGSDAWLPPDACGTTGDEKNCPAGRFRPGAWVEGCERACVCVCVCMTTKMDSAGYLPHPPPPGGTWCRG